MRLPKFYHVSVFIVIALFANSLALAQSEPDGGSKEILEIQRTGASYYNRGEYEKAIAAYKRAIEIDRDSTEIYFHLGMAYSSLGKYKEAVEAYTRAVRIKPDYAAAHYNLGHAYSNLNRHEKAVKAFRQSIRYEPDNVEAYVALANAYFDSGNQERAFDTFEAAINRWPDNPYAYYRLGLVYFPAGLHARAADAFTQVIQRDARYAEAYFHRAYTYLFLGRGESAARDAETYISLKGWRAEHSLDMALVSYFGHLQARQEAAARKVLEEAALQGDKEMWPYPAIEYLLGKITALLLYRLAPDKAEKVEARAYIGLGLSLQGDHKAAREHFEWVKSHSASQPIPFYLVASEMERMKAVSAVSFKK
ncbi:MAG TPA: tetratricopeptide repeat protein [Blastocatellia bacterium]|nr:tetratricopeptide repeat protein [Blastocatellia bacterium]